MAPELISGQRKYDSKIDVWSLGIFGIELSDGAPPWANKESERVLYLIVKKNPPKINDRYSSDFKDFISKCLMKDPEKRSSVKELLKHPFMKSALDHKEEFVKFVQKWNKNKK